MGNAAIRFVAAVMGSFVAVLLFLLTLGGVTAILLGLGLPEPVAGGAGLGAWYLLRSLISRRVRPQSEAP